MEHQTEFRIHVIAKKLSNNFFFFVERTFKNVFGNGLFTHSFLLYLFIYFTKYIKYSMIGKKRHW